MKVEVRMHNLSELKKRLLDSDMNHTKYILLDEMRNSIDKLKGDRNPMFKIVHMMSRVTKMSEVTVDTMIMSLEQMTLFDIMNYEIKYEDDMTVLMINVDDAYFEIFNKIPLIGRFISSLSGGRKQYVEEIRKTIENEYTKDYQIKVIAEDDGKEVE